MTSREFTAITATAVLLLAGAACAPSPEPDSAPAGGLDDWEDANVPRPAEGGFSMAGVTGPEGDRSGGSTSGVEPGWYAVTTVCEATGPGAATGSRSASIVISGEGGVHGEGDCGSGPVTTTVRFGASDGASPETIAVEAEAEGHEFYWGVSASPTTAPE